MVTEPYQNWKDFYEDIANRAFNEYHINYMARLNEFIDAMKNPALLEKCPNKEFFLVHIFPQSDCNS